MRQSACVLSIDDGSYHSLLLEGTYLWRTVFECCDTWHELSRMRHTEHKECEHQNTKEPSVQQVSQSSRIRPTQQSQFRLTDLLPALDITSYLGFAEILCCCVNEDTFQRSMNETHLPSKVSAKMFWSDHDLGPREINCCGPTSGNHCSLKALSCANPDQRKLSHELSLFDLLCRSQHSESEGRRTGRQASRMWSRADPRTFKLKHTHRPRTTTAVWLDRKTHEDWYRWEEHLA